MEDDEGHILPASIASDVDRIRVARNDVLNLMENTEPNADDKEMFTRILDALGDAETGLFYLSGKLMGIQENGVYRIELKDGDGECTDVVLAFNGEIAFHVGVKNAVNAGTDMSDHTKVESATATITTWPIEGGLGQKAKVTLLMAGSDS